jgi:integrase/recombinase XerC
MLVEIMSTSLTVIAPPGGEITTRLIDPQRLIERWQAGRSAETLRAYQGSLEHFAQWANQPGPGAAVTWFFQLDQGEAHEQAHAYRAHMIDAGLAAATINARLSALRSITTLAYGFGYVRWHLQLDGVRAEKYRDTRGPEPDDVIRLLELAAGQEHKPTAARDVAMLMLLGYGAALRRAEMCKLDLAHFDHRGGRLEIMGKGRRQTEWVSLPAGVVKALRAWVRHRGREPGPLFLRLDNGATSRTLDECRLTGEGVRWILKRFGEQLDLVVRPHGLRHSAITAALDETNGNVRAVRKFSRHKQVETLLIYDDNRSDLGGNVAKQLAQRMDKIFAAIGENDGEA